MSAAFEDGRKPGTRAADESDPDLAQAFVDLALGDSAKWRLRVGRQELAFGRYITVRDGANLRRTFDGARLTGPIAQGILDVFAVAPTLQRAGAFDDRPDGGDHAWGLSFTRPQSRQTRWIATYFGRENERAAYAAGPGVERRHALALRYQSTRGPWDFDGQFSYQFGEFQPRSGAPLDIRATGFATETGYSFKHAAWTPRIALRLDGAGGDRNPNDARLSTIDLAYPNLTYISDASAFAPRNLCGVQPFVTIVPVKALSLTAGTGFLWRRESGDAVFSPPNVRLLCAQAPSDNYIATQSYLRALWRMNPFVDIAGSAVHAEAQGAFAQAGLKDIDFLALQVSAKF